MKREWQYYIVWGVYLKHIGIWNNESYRKLAIGILLRILGQIWFCVRGLISVGLDVLLKLSWFLNITMISSLVVHKRAVLTSWKDVSIISSERRDTLKFLRKRTTCKCLKKMHLEARKTIPKMGLCWNCKEEKNRVSLSVCSKCMVIQYCSRECQVAAWPGHKEFCCLIQPWINKPYDYDDSLCLFEVMTSWRSLLWHHNWKIEQWKYMLSLFSRFVLFAILTLSYHI